MTTIKKQQGQALHFFSQYVGMIVGDRKKSAGQALIMVVLIGVIAIIAVVSASTLVISELRKNTSAASGVAQYAITYGTLENAFIRLLRDPNYVGETVSLSTSTCYISVTGALTKAVDARCTDGRYVRKMVATVTFLDGNMTVSNISEVP